jgi:hypothetical protein
LRIALNWCYWLAKEPDNWKKALMSFCRGRDKDTVLALREIAAGFVTEENVDRLHRTGYVSETHLEI